MEFVRGYNCYDCDKYVSILAFLKLDGEVEKLIREYEPLLAHHKQKSEYVQRENPRNPYAKLQYDLYHNLSTPVAFIFHNYDEYFEYNDISNNLYDQCFFNGDVTDATFTTYLEEKRISIDDGTMIISSIAFGLFAYC